jgi:hypothetical protein
MICIKLARAGNRKTPMSSAADLFEALIAGARIGDGMDIVPSSSAYAARITITERAEAALNFEPAEIVPVSPAPLEQALSEMPAITLNLERVTLAPVRARLLSALATLEIMGAHAPFTDMAATMVRLTPEKLLALPADLVSLIAARAQLLMQRALLRITDSMERLLRGFYASLPHVLARGHAQEAILRLMCFISCNDSYAEAFFDENGLMPGCEAAWTAYRSRFNDRVSQWGREITGRHMGDAAAFKGAKDPQWCAAHIQWLWSVLEALPISGGLALAASADAAQQAAICGLAPFIASGIALCVDLSRDASSAPESVADFRTVRNARVLQSTISQEVAFAEIVAYIASDLRFAHLDDADIEKLRASIDEMLPVSGFRRSPMIETRIGNCPSDSEWAKAAADRARLCPNDWARALRLAQDLDTFEREVTQFLYLPGDLYFALLCLKCNAEEQFLLVTGRFKTYLSGNIRASAVGTAARFPEHQRAFPEQYPRHEQTSAAFARAYIAIMQRFEPVSFPSGKIIAAAVVVAVLLALIAKMGVSFRDLEPIVTAIDGGVNWVAENVLAPAMRPLLPAVRWGSRFTQSISPDFQMVKEKILSTLLETKDLPFASHMNQARSVTWRSTYELVQESDSYRQLPIENINALFVSVNPELQIPPTQNQFIVQFLQSGVAQIVAGGAEQLSRLVTSGNQLVGLDPDNPALKLGLLGIFTLLVIIKFSGVGRAKTARWRHGSAAKKVNVVSSEPPPRPPARTQLDDNVSFETLRGANGLYPGLDGLTHAAGRVLTNEETVPTYQRDDYGAVPLSHAEGLPSAPSATEVATQLSVPRAMTQPANITDVQLADPERYLVETYGQDYFIPKWHFLKMFWGQMPATPLFIATQPFYNTFYEATTKFARGSAPEKQQGFQ